MKVLLPTSSSVSAPELVKQLVAAPPLQPFAPELLDFVGRVGAELLADRTLRAQPELLVLAHWFRPAELHKLRLEHEKLSAWRHRRVARGVVLHLAPANVDVMFVYPWLLALLLGNRNIVRVSRRYGPAAEALLSAVTRVLERSDMSNLATRSLVVTYDHEADWTRDLSQLCDVRTIWGSNDTIRSVRAIPLPVRATEVAFCDRFSLALLGADVVAELSEPELLHLAQLFSNDSLWFDQMACSSPRALVWFGTAQRMRAAQQRFWAAVHGYALRHRSLTQPAMAVERFATTCHMAAALDAQRVIYDHPAGIARVEMQALEPSHRAAHRGGGVFIEVLCEDLQKLAAWLKPEDQTLVHFGVAQSQLEQLVEHGLDRIVPVGDALKFETSWDGVDLMQAFTRECVVRV
jgi:hypothetical protein